MKTFFACLLAFTLGVGVRAGDYDKGYQQGAIDQAAIQKELRKGICE